MYRLKTDNASRKICKKAAMALSFRHAGGKNVSPCVKAHREWVAIKRFSDMGGWELIAQCHRQERQWQKWSEKNCN